MRSIGIRELRQQASRYLRVVERGEIVEVTDRGRPVARLVPIDPVGPLARLAAAGRLQPATGDVLKLAPLRPARRRPLPSEVLARNRADER